MTNIVTPGPISGFPEYLPEARMLEQKFIDTIRTSYERSGFVNIETPAVERVGTLVSKWADDKEIYTVGRLQADKDKSKNSEYDDKDGWEDKLALHFDLTVPTARYVARHYSNLVFPFRRHQIQKVWRGERAQGGRFKEFYQADIDIVGDGALSLDADADILTTLDRTLSDLNIGKYTFHVNNRKILVGFVKHIGVEDDNVMMVIWVIDKVLKIGEQWVQKFLEDMGLSSDKITLILELCSLSNRGNQEVLQFLKSVNSKEVQAWVEELESVYKKAVMLGINPDNILFNPSIARWLEYYTGIIFETFLDGTESAWSICSWGRYDNLASHFTEKKLPGVGWSIGASRLFDRLLKNKRLVPSNQTPSKVLITRLQEKYEDMYLGLVRDLRQAGVQSEMYIDGSVKIGKQLGYANKKGIPYAIVAWDEEVSRWEVQLKHMYTGDREQVAIENIVSRVKELLSQEK